ncbi:MAG: AAA family ATPase [Bacilli bacterium]|nr:AAA family ATPase [Bacilli bacterium]
MLYKRRIYNELEKWKKSLKVKKKAFVLKGLRQVGKTTIICEFAKNNWPNVIYFNFKLEPIAKEIFSDNLDISTIIKLITSIKHNATFVANKTVLIFDEIQECSGARASIKSFMLDGRFDVIASGSLLGIKGYNASYHGGIPVGYEHTVYMKPMDFEEFLWARGMNESIINEIKNNYKNNTKVNLILHKQFSTLFKEYICVGGMPAVVDVFNKTGDMNQVRKEQLDILESFKDDYGKHLDINEKETNDIPLLTKINNVFKSIPSQLAKENKKFMISKINKDASLAKYNDAITWLIDYGLIDKCHNLTTPSFPLDGYLTENIFKIYMCDTGLFMASLSFDSISSILLDDMGIYKGAVYENVIADALIKNNKPLYYYSRESGLEIDFVTTINNEIYIIEVKSRNGNSKSAKEVLTNKKRYPNVKGLIKLTDTNVSKIGNIKTIPLYLAFLIK